MEPHRRLDQAMNARRIELGLNWRDIAERAEVSYESLRRIRKGDYRPSTLAAHRLDAALKWARGSVEKVLDGGNPIPLENGLAAKAPKVRTQAGLSERETRQQHLALALVEAEKALASATEEELEEFEERYGALIRGFRRRLREKREQRRDAG